MYYRVNGKRTQETFYPIVPLSGSSDTNGSDSTAPTSKRFPLWAIILIVLVVLAVVGFIIYLAFGNNKPSQKFGYRFYK